MHVRVQVSSLAFDRQDVSRSASQATAGASTAQAAESADQHGRTARLEQLLPSHRRQGNWQNSGGLFPLLPCCPSDDNSLIPQGDMEITLES